MLLTLLDVIYAAIEECIQNVKGTESGVCDSTDGSFESECKEGFTGSGFECEGISKHVIKLQLTVFLMSNISYHFEYVYILSQLCHKGAAICPSCFVCQKENTVNFVTENHY